MADGEAYLAGRCVSETQIGSWVEQFNTQGFLYLENVLPPDWCAELRSDLESAFEERKDELGASPNGYDLMPRMFESSEANLRLFDLEPIVSLAEALVDPGCHVIHNNSFRTYPGGGLSTWHQDDPPHYVVTEGKPPANVRLPVLFFTANYYLTDVTERAHGGTEVVSGSHLFGKAPPGGLVGTEWEGDVTYNLGKAGSLVMFNNQVWHRGGPNETERTRYITQVTYARRIIGHKYYPFMNYQMPEHVFADADERRKRLLGFLKSGAYG